VQNLSLTGGEGGGGGGGGGDPNANVAVVSRPGAASARVGEATAEIEFDSEDTNVTVDLPVVENSDIPALFR
jgi:hypothetical protein